MDKKNKKADEDYLNKEIQPDEMQRAVSYELEHKTLWLWYVLNSFTMWVAYFMFIGTENTDWTIPTPIQVLIVLYYGVMLFCLSLYGIQASDKGVLNSFSHYQKGLKGWKYIIGVFNLSFPITCFMSAVNGRFEGKANNYKIFFLTVFLMAAAYEFISAFCVAHNKKVCDSIAADDEEPENNDN